MDCSPEYVEGVESKQKLTACVGVDQLMKRKNRRSRHMTMKYDNMSKMISDLDAAKQLNKGESMQKLSALENELMKQGTGKAGHAEDATPAKKDDQREQLGDKVKSCLKKGQGQLTEIVDGYVGKNKVTRRELTKRMLGFYKLRKKVITIKKEKARLMKSMENLVQKHQNIKLKLVEERESAEIKAAELKSLNLVLIGKEGELKGKEEEIKCMKVNVADMKVS
ncbi:uncharacterized protein LOC130644263 [Hydractinia symbiolongicarpus]|uniref:uncharacterized protein LOC130644263 n=1 Tax=Hydractinia symbiolongicarpus TaxID=13093 RepID=UPI00254CB8E1|nr:uncharacterized protein LOC130644263 [Hydractinia symbiolongicarpus]